MDISQIMKMATQMQEQMKALKSQASSVKVVGEAGGGLVRVTMNGRHEILEVHIDPIAVKPSEAGLLEDLVRAAANTASAKVAEALQNQMGDLAKRMGLDPAMLGSIPGMGGLF